VFVTIGPDEKLQSLFQRVVTMFDVRLRDFWLQSKTSTLSQSHTCALYNIRDGDTIKLTWCTLLGGMQAYTTTPSEQVTSGVSELRADTSYSKRDVS
jgi:hypothetical protein